MGLREEIIRVLEEANQPLSDSEINERMEGEREDQAMWRPRKDLEEDGIIEGMGNHPTRWMLTDKEYESVRKEDHSRRDDSSEVNLRLERNLEKYIFDNLSTLESGLNRVTEGDSRQRQVDSGRLDILGEDEDGRLVVIELKTGEAKRDALGQTMAYMADIDEEFPEREVRGIVVSDSFSDKLTSAVSLQPNVQLYHYDVQFTFEEVG
jgi:hypothetical protein